MTEQIFRKKIIGFYKTDNVMNYVVCGIIIFGGLFLLYKTLAQKHDHYHNASSLFTVLFSLFPIAFGIYGLWRIRQDYIVKVVYSNANIDIKNKVVEEYLAKVKVLFKARDGNYYSYRYRNRFFLVVDLRVYLDEDKILFNAMAGDSSAGRGFIDFGLTNRATKKFENHLKACL